MTGNDNKNSHYVPLHVHFFSSYLDGAIRYDDIEKLKERGFQATAITDHGNLSGTYEFFKKCRKFDVKPIIGIETYWAFDRKLKAKDELGDERPSYHMLMFALNNNGLKNLNRINSISWKDGFYYSPRADNALIAEYMGDLAATSACLGSITSQYILRNELDKAAYWLSYFKELFNGNFFIELQPHESLEDQKVVNRQLIKFSSQLNIPMVVTGDSHYLDCHDNCLHDHLLALAMNRKINDPSRMRFTWDASIPSYSDMLLRCGICDIPEEAIANTRHLAGLVKDDYFHDRMNRWPSFKKLPPEFPSSEAYLRHLCLEGYKKIYKADMSEEHKQRLEEEIPVLKIMGYIDYILILWDILLYAADKKILVGMGRGSVAGCYVAYLLGITKVDPFKYNLLFSRFCNEGRAATPIILDGY